MTLFLLLRKDTLITAWDNPRPARQPHEDGAEEKKDRDFFWNVRGVSTMSRDISTE
jgi:hypothetical protein